MPKHRTCSSQHAAQRMGLPILSAKDAPVLGKITKLDLKPEVKQTEFLCPLVAEEIRYAI